jgi:hypothetical protein
MWWLDFKLEPIFSTAPATSKNNSHYKTSQNSLKNNHLATLIYVGETDCIFGFSAIPFDAKPTFISINFITLSCALVPADLCLKTNSKLLEINKR